MIDSKKLAALEGVDEADLGISEPETSAQAALEPETAPDNMTPEQRKRRRDAMRDLARLRAEAARVPNDLQKLRDGEAGGRSGHTVHGGTAISMFIPDKRRVL